MSLSDIPVEEISDSLLQDNPFLSQPAPLSPVSAEVSVEKKKKILLLST